MRMFLSHLVCAMLGCDALEVPGRAFAAAAVQLQHIADSASALQDCSTQDLMDELIHQHISVVRRTAT